MPYIELEQLTDGVPGWGLGVKRYFEHPESVTCDVALASFLDFDPDDQLASSSLTEPTPPSGKIRQVVDCTTSGSTNDVTVDGDPAEWESYSGGGSPGGNPGGGSTPTATSTLIGHYRA